MTVKATKYIAAFLLPALAIYAFYANDWLTFLPVLFAFVLLPVTEAFVGKNTSNFTALQHEVVKADRWFDYAVYLTVPIQVFCLIIFLSEVSIFTQSTLSVTGKILSMGLMCGVFGINIAHELGHRNTPHEKLMAKVLLSTSMFLHFYIEHNRGHHKHVGTELDPATARKGESIYAFWPRTIFFSFLSAWKIVKTERTRRKLPVWSFGNEFIQYMIVQFAICVTIAIAFGFWVLVAFLAASLIGILLLESVNYIEHYGLYRKKLNEFRYEDVQPIHSWNSDFILGRIFLFELTRHSDHHTDPSKHYQCLDSIPESSHLPAGYPAMILCAMVPPLWFSTMNKRLEAFPT